jgi:ATP-binding cassette subfamily B multidrug efflux pump
VLNDLELAVEPGMIVGILGRTGSGKSTLVHLIPRVLDPAPGSLFIDGVDVRQYDLETLRSAIRMVPQETFLFSTSIKENIAFGGRDGSPASLEEVAAISTIDRDARSFPQGLGTVVGERGITLSGGQKQRVALSRALAQEASIYILDDALSSVDTETEEAILNRLLPHVRGKTVLLVSHRVSTLKSAGLIVVLEGGRISQQGSHERLLAEGGFYADIYRLQQLEQALRGKR